MKSKICYLPPLLDECSKLRSCSAIKRSSASIFGSLRGSSSSSNSSIYAFGSLLSFSSCGIVTFSSIFFDSPLLLLVLFLLLFVLLLFFLLLLFWIFILNPEVVLEDPLECSWFGGGGGGNGWFGCGGTGKNKYLKWIQAH